MIGMLDHEMHVERKRRVFSHRRDDRRPERNVIDEMAVHDVEMQPVRAGLLRRGESRLRGWEKSAARMEGATRIFGVE